METENFERQEKRFNRIVLSPKTRNAIIPKKELPEHTLNLTVFASVCRYFELYCVSRQMRQQTIRKYDIR